MKHFKTVFSLAWILILAGALTLGTFTYADAGSLFSLTAQNQCGPANGLRVLVAGVSENPEQKRLFEQAACEKLQKQGIDAKASFSVMPASMSDPMDRRAVEQKALRQGMDFVLFTRLAGIHETRSISPYDPMLYYLGLGDTGGMPNAHQQQYINQNAKTWKHVKLNCRLYDVKTAKMVWSDQLDIARPARSISARSVIDLATDKITRAVSVCKTPQG